MDDDDYYGSDDGFDALPANTLAQLERDALQSTQHQRARRALPQNKFLTRPATQGSDEDDSFVVLHRQQPPVEYGLEDEEILNLDTFPQHVRQELSQWPQRPAQVSDRGPVAQSFPSNTTNGKRTEASTDLADLQRRIAELEGENSSLQNAVSEAQVVAQSKTGEASLLRQRVEKNAKEYEHKLHLMRQMHNEADARQKAEVAALKRDREKMATDNRFLAHDLVLEAGKNRQVKPAARTNGNESPGTTPKRHKTLPYRDGFDDDDIMLLSPSRARSRSKTATPRAAGKRKREPAPQSPVRPLVLQPVEASPRGKGEAAGEMKARIELQQRLDTEHGRSRLLRRLVEHRSQYTVGDGQLIDSLSAFALPDVKPDSTSEKRNLASLFIERAIRSVSEDGDPAVHICQTVVSLLDECMRLAYYGPVNMLIEMISTIVQVQGMDFARTLISDTIPLVIAACDLVAFPIARAAVKTNSTLHDSTAQPPAPDIDVVQGLSLLQTIARACTFDVEAAQTFWRLPSFEFMMVMLMKVQPLEQILSMLQLLGTSILPDSFGVISSSSSTRSGSREADTINRLSLLLTEKFTQSSGDNAKSTTKESRANAEEVLEGEAMFDAENEYDREDLVLQIQQETASIFLTLCTTEHGAVAIATHRHALGRLVRFLHNCVISLYDYSDNTHGHLVTAINTTMRVVHHVITTQIQLIDIRERLRNVPGGPHMWLLSLTRLAFMEGIVAEDGIATETSDMAHQLLDEYLSPDEGEQLLQVFSTGVSAD